MAFSEQFLEELRNRVDLTEVIGRSVKLARKGREHLGLCPFHKEKTPSFTVNEEKGFYHCFGCQAHGSVFDFIMETEGLNFPEAVEKLASEIGIQIPSDTPEERERQKKRQKLTDVVELAAAFFERQLRIPEGRKGLEYLHHRGLTDPTIRRFRLGFATESRHRLKAHLTGQGIEEGLMIAAGLVIKPDDGHKNRKLESYDRFRGRIMFPICDRRGRVIGFGGRIIGNGEPKYLNSPETTLFQKRALLYGLHLASSAVRKNEVLIVTEGYMDVISLAQAGFNGSVAPLGTALTEDQIQLLWKINREAVLCLDGDAAGARAAIKAAEKALPFLKPGYGLRFAKLPEGTDPDDLIKLGGAQAMQQVLDEAQPLSEVLWHIETGDRLPATAEARAGVEARLKDHTRRIQDPTIRAHFSRLFGERLWPTREKNRNWHSHRSTGSFGAHSTNSNMHLSSDQLGAPLNAREIRHMALIATLINHPDCFDEIGEALGTLAFSTQELDILRQQVLNTLAERSGLDSAGLITHLNQSGFAEILGRVLSPHVYGHGFFARPNTDRHAVLSGWKDALKMFRNDDLAQEIREAKRISRENPSEEASRQLQILTHQKLALQAEEDDAHSNI